MKNLWEKAGETLELKTVFVDEYNAVVGMVVALFTAIFGQYWYLFGAFLLFNVFDWASGWYKARRQQVETSAAGLKGVVKKLWYWVLVLVAFVVSGTFAALGKDLLGVDLAWLSLLGWFTLASLTINEARSILENLVVIGVKVPGFLVKGLAVAHRMVREKAPSGSWDTSAEQSPSGPPHVE